MLQTAGRIRTDIQTGTWIDRRIPGPARPYFRLARLDRPIGFWLLLFPCLWSIALASSGWPDPWLCTLFTVGALVMRGAGCTLNDIIDRDIDARVERTSVRPLPSGAISVKAAVVFLIAQLAVGLMVLVQLNAFTIVVGAASLVLVALYPFAKRVTYWPQAVLGLTFNWGALLGWAAVRATLDTPALVLYVASFFWTLGYDTIYAHQDRDDDARIGVKSTALLFGEATLAWLWVFYGLSVILLAGVGVTAGLAWPYWTALAAAAAHLGWQVAQLDIHAPGDCLAKFRANRWVGWIVLAGIIGGRVI